MLDEEQQKLAEELLFSTKKKPSFAKQLFFGRLDTSSIFPYPTPPDPNETEALLKELQAFIDEKIDPIWIDKHSEIPEEVIRGLGKMGVLSLTIPKQYGGLGLSQYAYCKAMEMIAGNCAATALFVNAHQSVGLKALLLFGTQAQRDKWLPPLGTGEAIAAFSLTEKNAGSDAGGIETTATFDSTKNIYRIKGRKQWTTNGSMASILTVMAKTANKVTAFIVTPDMSGFQVQDKALDKVGMRGSKTSNLNFDNVEVPAENILGPIGGGLKVCLTVLDYGRTTFGATCTGAAKKAVKLATEHAVNRYQFKRPLASFGLVKEKIARMHALLYAMEATTYLTAGLVDQGVEDFMLEAAILKVFTSESLWTILYDAMQIYGGRSFFTDMPLERMMRDARLNMIGEGSNEVLRVFIGAVGMRDVGVELKGFLDAFKHPIANWPEISGFSQKAMRYLKATTPKLHPELKSEAKQLGIAVRNFGVVVAQILGNFREEVVEKQLILDRIATSAIALYTITAVLSRLDADLKSKDKKTLENDIATAKLYCKQAFLTFEKCQRTMFQNEDAEIEALSDRITGVHTP